MGFAAKLEHGDGPAKIRNLLEGKNIILAKIHTTIWAAGGGDPLQSREVVIAKFLAYPLGDGKK